jgi:hypothetical protein
LAVMKDELQSRTNRKGAAHIARSELAALVSPCIRWRHKTLPPRKINS